MVIILRHLLNKAKSAVKTLLFHCTFLLSLQAYGINPESSEPIEIESEKATLNDKLGISTYEGSVLVKQGLSKMEADSIKVFSKDKRITSIEASGTPAHYVQQLNPEQEATHAYGDTIVYDANTAILRMTGNAKFVQGQNSFEGDNIEYDIRERAVKAEGSSTGDKKVRIQYQPNSEPSNPTQSIQPSSNEDS